MTWFRVDDKLHDHRKTRRARKRDGQRDAAPMGLWVLAGSWCMANLTDGFVPADELDRWDSNAEQLAQQLVAAELWHPAERDGEQGYQFHEWDDWQHTTAYIQKRREDAANRMRRRRANAAATSDADNTDTRSRERSTHVRKPPTQPNQTTHARARVSVSDETFDAFWQLYPKKVAKKDARKAFDRALRDTDEQTILRGARTAAQAWAKSGTERRFIPNPSTWLNQGRWDDEQQTSSTAAASSHVELDDPNDPEPDRLADAEAHLRWRQRRAARRQQLTKETA